MDTIVYCPGVFDLFHLGHLNILKRSKELGDILIVGVVSDSGTFMYKHHFPIVPEKERLEIIRNIKYVDFAIIQKGTDPTRELEVIRPQILTHGSDWEKLREGHDTLKRLGIKFVRLPYTKGISTTRRRGRI